METIDGLSGVSPPDLSYSIAAEPVAAILEQHLCLDDAIDQQLEEVVAETERSALAVMQQLRQLHDAASQLVTYLGGTSLEGGDVGKGIAGGMASLAHIGAFMEQLLPKAERDLQNVQMVVKEIKELSGLTEAVQAISMQSHLLAINAAIEASRAGSSGAAFRVVADELRVLASNSGAVAIKIIQGLSRARHTVEHGMASSIEESNKQLQQASTAASAIDGLRDNFDGMSQYFKTRLGVVTEHNEGLARDIAEVLGHMQTQDVARQRIERARVAIKQRNVLFRDAVAGLMAQDDIDESSLPQQLAWLLDDYLAEEEKHRHSAVEVPQDIGELKIELF